MGRRSRVEQLDPQIRESVHRLVRSGRTIDEISAHLDQFAGEGAPSRSSVGRYVRNTREQMARYREAQQLAKVWVGRIEEEPEGDVGRLLSEMLRTVAFQQLAESGDDGAEISTKEIAMLSGAIRDLSTADKTRTDVALRIRKEVAKEAADTAEAAARSQGLSDDGVAAMRAAILEGL